MNTSLLDSADDPDLPGRVVFDVKEAAAFLHIAVVSVRRLIWERKLRSIRIGKRVLILRKDLLDFLGGLRG